ncbi:hypothetical protein [Porphyromonas asaccharolytica]|uniref:Uncharacterized protein n=1 Tax=Porphyromonas asaccharolytica (strain ATCC 25260 / DSM 20707 / BCRC 10618 / CCUG 7834 / JCM 6326 / LMG 13178 / VPI 4198 / B440) TaxID=879243 RepID=F4KJB2_PORAD|nr:hypothetical protein [Porphyromonas asaccharolytica]AEE12555.1 hypothetical protein Poras_0604 [Porphyromonas asaccharolytica DSM 20707]
MTQSSLPNRAVYNEPTRSDEGTRPTFSQILRLILKQWYWFVLSFVLFVVLGKIVADHRPLGRQTYYMQLSSREPHELTNPMMTLSDSTFKTSPWTPEYIATLLNTTTAVVEAGRRINFQVDYFVKTPWGMRDYYNQTPIIVHFDDLLPTDKVHCIAKLDDPVHPQQVTLSGFLGTAQGISINEPYDVVIPVGSTQETPVGHVSITLDNPKHHFPYHIDQKHKKIALSYSTLQDIRAVYETEMQVTMKKADLPLSSVMRVEMLSNRSERRCLDLLYQMYLVTDSLGWVEQLSDEGVTDSLGQFAGTVPPAGLSPFRLIDEPRIAKDLEPDLFIIAGMGLLGLLLPLLLMYIYWAIRGVIYYVSELPSLLRHRLTLDLKRGRKGKKPLYPNLEELCALVMPPQGEPRTIQLATPNSTKYHDQLLAELQQALEQRGISCAVWHLDLAEQKAVSKTPSDVYHTTLTPGLISSTAFQQQLKQLQTQHQLTIIASPALMEDPTAYLLSSSVEQSLYCIYRGSTRVRAIKRIVHQLQIRQLLDRSRIEILWIE